LRGYICGGGYKKWVIKIVLHSVCTGHQVTSSVKNLKIDFSNKVEYILILTDMAKEKKEKIVKDDAEDNYEKRLSAVLTFAKPLASKKLNKKSVENRQEIIQGQTCQERSQGSRQGFKKG
jgi:hypothetical protein